MNRKIILLPLSFAAILALAACNPSTNSTTSVTPVESSSTPAVATVTSVTVTAADSATSVAIGGTLQLSAAVVGTNNPSTLVTWSSSADATATVSASGLVTGVAAGSVTITATSKADTTKKGTIILTVAEKVDKISDLNAVGTVYNVKAVVVGKDLQDVAFSDGTGIIYAYFGSGKTTDTYKIADFAIGDYYNIKAPVGYYYGVYQFYPNGGTDSNKATVAAFTSATKLTETAPTIDKTAVELTSAMIDAHKGTTTVTSDWGMSAIKFVKYTSVLTIELGTSYNIYHTKVGTYDTRLHSLDTTAFPGLVNGVKYDVVGLDFGYNSGNGYQNVLVTSITKVDVSLTGITITGDDTVAAGKSITLTSTGTPEGADGSCTWSSATTAVATVDADTGVVTGVAAGTSVITATSKINSAITATKIITVTAEVAPVALPYSTTINKAVPDGWTIAEEGYASYNPAYYTSGALKINFEKIYMITAKFVASAAAGVKVSLTLDGLNAGSKTATAAATDPVFTVTGYKADGTTVVTTGTILNSAITAAGTFDVTLAGADISIVKIYTTNLPTSGTMKANMSLKTVAITAA